MKRITSRVWVLLVALLTTMTVQALESYDFQELCMKLGKGGPWAVNDGGDAGFTINDATMHYLGDYTDQGFTWNQRFAYEYVDGRDKFTMRNKNNNKDKNCGMFSWDYAHYFSILDLKNGDKVTITIGSGTVTFANDAAEGVAAGDAVTSKKTYTIATTEESTRLDIQMAKASLIFKIEIEPYGVETVPVISVTPKTLKLIPTATAKVTASVSPALPTQWTSSDEGVATVDANGTVTAIAAGTATIMNSWASEVSDATASDQCEVTVADIDLSAYEVVKAYDFTAMGDVTLTLNEEAAGAIWNEANSKTNNVFYCTNEGLELVAVQAAVSSNKGWSIVDGQGLVLASGAGRCAAIGGIKQGQIVEFIYTGNGFYTRSSDDGIEKTALNEATGRAIYLADEDGMIGFELDKGNAVKQINIYEKAAEVEDYTSHIVNAGLTGTDGWNTEGTKGYHKVGGVVTCGNNAQFDFSQTISNLPAGKYKLTAQAAYRYSGSEADEYAAIQAGSTTKFASLYATVGTKTTNVLVKNRYDDASEFDYANGEGSVQVNNLYVPNSTAAVKAWFTAGKYVNEVEFDLPADGDVKIGIVKTAQPEAGDFTAIGPWTLARIGDAEVEPDPEVPVVEPGTDMTSYIVNPSFETGDLTGWSVVASSDTGVKTNTGDYVTEGIDGNYLFNTWWKGNPITQTVTGLPNGRYELKALMTSDPGDHLYLIANGEHSTVFGSPNGKGEFVEGSMEFDVLNGTATIGAVGGNDDGSFREDGYYWYKADNFRLTYVKGFDLTELAEAYDAALAAAQAVEGKMNAEVAAALAAAIAAEVDKTNADALNTAVAALTDATTAAKASVAAYANAKVALDGIEALLLTNNVYTEEALNTYYTEPKAKYEDGTLSDEEASKMADPQLQRVWNHDNGKINSAILLSAWYIGEQKAVDYATSLYINDWSTEGNDDGSEFRVPFYEYWTDDNKSLGENTLKAIITPRDWKAGNVYDVEAWTRVRIKDNGGEEAYGITLQVGDGEAINACAGNQVGTSQFRLANLKATGKVSDKGVLTIKFTVAADNNISWLSFKNVLYTYNDDVTTGIQIVETKSVKSEAVYNIAGQRVVNAQKGLYIVNGKKVIF